MTDSRVRLIGLLSVTAGAALMLASLLPTKWVPRTGLGWEDDHFIVYFATTMMLSLVSRRPYVVAITLMICAGVLEAVQGLTPDRVPDFMTALTGAVGVLSAATLAILLIRARRWLMARRGDPTWFRSVVHRLSHRRQISQASSHSTQRPMAEC